MPGIGLEIFDILRNDFVWKVKPIAACKILIIRVLFCSFHRLISGYFAFSRSNKSPMDFHKGVEDAIAKFNKCLKQRTLRTCANVSPYFSFPVSQCNVTTKSHHTTTNEIQFFNLGNSLQLRKKTLP